MRPLTIFFLAGSLMVAIGCDKPSGSGAPAASGSPLSGSAAPPPAPVASATAFGAGFEGGLVMHTTSALGAKDALFIFKGPKLRVDVPQPDGRPSHTLFDSTTKKITIVMDSQRLALQMPIPAPVPGDATQPPTITKTGKRETVAGYDCEDWQIVAASGGHQTACVAEGMPFFDFSATGGPTGAHTWADELRDKNAFPLRVVDVDAKGRELSRMEVTKVERRAVDDSDFAVPQGYNVMVVPGVVGTAGITAPHPK